MANVKFHERFSPAEATRGQYVPIDTSTLSDYPISGSRGRYTQLNYIVGSEPGALSLALSGGNVILPVSAVNIEEPLQIENTPGQLFTVSQNLPDSVYVESVTLTANQIKQITFTTPIQIIELYNNSGSNDIYYLPYLTTSAVLSADGLPIKHNSYYSMDRSISTISIYNDSVTNSDVKILGHYKA